MSSGFFCFLVVVVVVFLFVVGCLQFLRRFLYSPSLGSPSAPDHLASICCPLLYHHFHIFNCPTQSPQTSAETS